MRAFLTGLAGLAVLGLVLFIGLHYIAAPSIVAQKSATLSTASVNEETSTYAIKIDYPQFGISSVDAQIQKDIANAVDEFRSLPPDPPESAAPQNSFDGSFGSVYLGPDIVSAQLILSQYTGGAHPMTILSGVSFDRMSGKRLLVDDALALIGKTIAQVSAEASAQFEEKFGKDFFSEGANTDPENFSSFTISANQVTFIFQPYQVAAYAAGPQMVSFPRVE